MASVQSKSVRFEIANVGPDKIRKADKGKEQQSASRLFVSRPDAAKRSGSAPELSELHRLIGKALYFHKAEERASAFSELGLLEPTPQILFACGRGLQDPQEEVRLEAVLALETLEDPYGIPLLREVIERDPSSHVREAALESLAELLSRTGQEARTASSLSRKLN